jgi:hypothetical protein
MVFGQRRENIILCQYFRSNSNKSGILHVKSSQAERALSLQERTSTVVVEGLCCWLVGAEFNSWSSGFVFRIFLNSGLEIWSKLLQNFYEISLFSQNS